MLSDCYCAVIFIWPLFVLKFTPPCPHDKHRKFCLPVLVSITCVCLSFGMSAPAISPLDEDGSVSRLLIACDRVVCQYGRCVLVNGEASCECNLGYMGDSCNETINEALSVPLTVGVLLVIVCLFIFMFGMAFFRQRQKAKKRRKIAEETLIRNGAHL